MSMLRVYQLIITPSSLCGVKIWIFIFVHVFLQQRFFMVNWYSFSVINFWKLLRNIL
ncbi:hypothetical protein CJA_1383 [Cellvibrio japonicus Ueda107]|uniref:Uncharacterized protein n=1 Tax=Cellvibrio japonicus (strain Ueda107) TaxID=498211 RepID=B3PD18_CELJU|nr:hypothetical protein CJA_1383 [Cellvibrio japonicus Ueda107]